MSRIRRSYRRLLVAAGLTLPAALAACGGGGTPAPRPTATPSANRAVAPPAPPRDITIAFAGDVHFADRTVPLLDDPATAFGPVSDVFTAADFAMVNLETAVTTRGTPQPKTFHFRTDPRAYAAIKAAGVDLVTVANNHAEDYGRVGLADTVASAKAADLPMVGAGANADEAWAPYIADIRGTKVAFIGISQIAELASSWIATGDRSGIAQADDLDRSLAAVREARRHADAVIVYMHWGQEGNHCPIDAQRSIARKLADAGAAAVVGTHAHLLLGSGYLGDAFVDYGLGNFLWWLDDAFSNDTGVLELTLHDGRVVRTSFVPAEISRRTGQPIPAGGAEKSRILRKYAGLRSCTGLTVAPP